jgi:aspartokinase-like uncharacterized kinase
MPLERTPPLTVVKVGGSLLDLPDLGPRLSRWLRGLRRTHILLVPGGGPAAEVVRDYDRIHHLGEERAHWLALAALALNARFLREMLPDHPEVAGWQEVRHTLNVFGLCILDPYQLALVEDCRPSGLPHDWSVTSDSLAARAAALYAAHKLILLKSVAIPRKLSWTEAGRRGLVDSGFAGAIGKRLVVQAINFREWKG